ncbi:transcription factor KUA1-like isoform X1 [Carya illinoinensis]|uniref:transcription factor KUA1-like isoform X1 n=1 Tax=Carya illinoinensis TaxID=32201 RepID=UPI001C71C102|nr:transcription factor KUA1-like isoform X1 [Carya illinoinensis]
MGRKCSHCGNKGHNSRTCTSNRVTFAGGLRLFGVQLDLSSSSVAMKRSFSMDCLYSSSPSSLSSPPSSLSSSRISTDGNSDKITIGYLSDGLTGRVRPQERKRGVPWTEEEHQTFLIGLEKLGKGDWRGIARNYVTTRTPTQVASHAQKYFLRQANLDMKKKRRSSLFDMLQVGSSNRAGQSNESCNPKQRVPVSTRYAFEENVPHNTSSTIDPLLGLSRSEHFKSENQETVWLYGLIDSHLMMNTSNTAKPSSPNAAVPNLELTLAAPRPL